MSTATTMAWQRRRKLAGLCQVCGEARDKASKSYCTRHREIARIKNRNRYRRQHGIPEDAAPYSSKRRSRLLTELEQAFRRALERTTQP